MRVDQIITLVWAGNVALLGATGWVGWKFWEQKQAQGQAAKIAWPDADARNPVEQRWPGAVTNFKHLWETQLNGLVPPPPKPIDEGPKKPVDLRSAFQSRIKVLTGFGASAPESRAIYVTDTQRPAAPYTVSPGHYLDDWQLVRVEFDSESKVHAFFSNRADDKGPLEIVSDQATVPDVGKAGEPPIFQPTYGDATEQGYPSRTKVDPEAYVDPVTAEWVVPSAEVAWWERWGDEDVLKKTKFVSRPQGLEIASSPPPAALHGGRGINQGDILVSINGFPVRSLDDVLGYLRGEGRGLTRYEVVIERDGSRRTQVYRVSRPRRGQVE